MNKTAEEILDSKKANDEYPNYYHYDTVIEAMEEYAASQPGEQPSTPAPEEWKEAVQKAAINYWNTPTTEPAFNAGAEWAKEWYKLNIVAEDMIQIQILQQSNASLQREVERLKEDRNNWFEMWKKACEVLKFYKRFQTKERDATLRSHKQSQEITSLRAKVSELEKQLAEAGKALDEALKDRH